MTVIDKITEVIRVAETAGRRKITGRLIAPGTVKRVFGDRQQFNMRETCLLDIVHQPFGQLTIVQELPLPVTLPGAKMDFVD